MSKYLVHLQSLIVEAENDEEAIEKAKEQLKGAGQPEFEYPEKLPE
jgi:hypothetical protein